MPDAIHVPSTEDILRIAHDWDFVREVGGQNAGIWVNVVQKVTGNTTGDSWCASWVSLILGIAFKGKSPLPRSASCDVLLEAARAQGWLTDTPSVGDLYLRLLSQTDAHHVGILVSVDPLVGISGNTSHDGTSSNGDRVAEHELHPKPGTIIYVHYPRGD